jgi:predicted membrane protein
MKVELFILIVTVMENNHHHWKPKRMKKVVFGIFVVVAGVLLLAFNTGSLPEEYKGYVFSWQSLIIAIGVINLFSRDSWLCGLVMVSVGSFFLLPEIHQFDFEFKKVFWPALIILIGLVIIVRRSHFQRFFQKKKKQNYKLEDGFIEEINVFGGSKRRLDTTIFRGGEVVNVFGGTELDLRGTTLSDEKNVLEVICVFGGMHLIVPSDWTVHVETTALFGGWSDKRETISIEDKGKNELFVKGVTVFGGGEIRTYPHS